tara:strand:+ start:636 stop:1712 length:1077 start_codon:yes stop_codon:yes gene_type:complete
MKVCILGAGLSSLTLAKALVNQNIYVDIVGEKKNYYIDKSRTIGISKTNLQFFKDHLINIENISWKLKKIEIYSENLKKEKLINFEDNKSELFSIVKNFKLYDLLAKSLAKSKYYKKKNFKKHFNFSKNYNLVINTDYSNYITKKYFSKNIIKKYNSFAYTTIIEHPKVQNNTAIQIFTKRGPLAFLPISNSETSIVYSLDNLSKEKDENIISLINEHNFKYKIKKISKIKSYELKSLSLRSYFHDNILAFGDLLHRIHPLAGQGFNMTIRDLKLLLDIIEYRRNLGLSLDSSINLELEKKIKHKNFIFSNGIDLIHEFFNLERKMKNNILSKSVQLIAKNPSINKLFTKIADKGVTL